MRAVWTITRKDLLLRFRDRSILLYGVLAPLVIATVLGLTFSGLEERITLDLAVVAGGQDEVAAPFVDEVLPALVEDGLVTEVTRYDDVETARTAVARAEHTAAIVFTAGGTVGPGDIEVLGNVDAPTGVGVTEAIVEGYADGVRAVSLVVGAGMANGAGDPQALVTAARDAGNALILREEPVGIVPIDITTYMAAGMAVFFLLFSVGIAATGMLEEERDRTLARLETAPIPSWAPLAAKALTAFLVGVGSMTALAVLTTLLIGAEWGDPLAVGVLIVAAVLAATGLIGFVASFTRTPESAEGALGVVATVLGALGGSFFPLRDVGALDVLSTFTPHHWFLQGLTKVAGGGDIGDVAGSVAALVAIGVLTAVPAVVRLQRSWGA